MSEQSDLIGADAADYLEAERNAAWMVDRGTARLLLERCLPMLVRLGDFLGNGPIDDARPGSIGSRCDLIGDIKDYLEERY